MVVLSPSLPSEAIQLHLSLCLQGVLLTHRAVASEVQSLGSWMGALGFGVDDEKHPHNDVYLSFLPLAHIYGR